MVDGLHGIEGRDAYHVKAVVLASCFRQLDMASGSNEWERHCEADLDCRRS